MMIVDPAYGYQAESRYLTAVNVPARILPVNARLLILLALIAVSLGADPVRGAAHFAFIAVTTRIQPSDQIYNPLSAFKNRIAIDLCAVAVGTGQAPGRGGSAEDAVAKNLPSELKFIADGLDINRHDLMLNAGVVIGPESHSASVDGCKDVVSISARGGDSGVNKTELRFSHDPRTNLKATQNGAVWYQEAGGAIQEAIRRQEILHGHPRASRSPRCRRI